MKLKPPSLRTGQRELFSERVISTKLDAVVLLERLDAFADTNQSLRWPTSPLECYFAAKRTQELDQGIFFLGR